MKIDETITGGSLMYSPPKFNVVTRSRQSGKSEDTFQQLYGYYYDKMIQGYAAPKVFKWDSLGDTMFPSLVNKELKEKKMADSEDLRAARKLDATHYRLYKAGLVDADGDVSEEGTELMDQILFEENIDKVIAVLDKQDAAKKPAKAE